MHAGSTRRRIGAAAVAVVAILLGWAGPASAHAAVVSSSPGQGAHLRVVPRTVTVAFDQPVQPDGGGLAVLDSSGHSVQIGSGRPSPSVLTAALPSSLGQGAYVADYTVTSVDGHVVSGGIVFLVGNAKPGAITQLARPATSLTNWVDDGGQFLVYAGVLLATGLIFFLTFVLGDVAERARLGRWAWWAAGVGVLGMAVTVGAQAALTGGGVGALGHWTFDREAVVGKLGAQCGLQLLGLAACLGSQHVRNTVGRQLAAFYGLLVAAGAFVVFGHAVVSPERWLSIPADIVHAVFAAIWAGGLVGLVAVLRARFRSAAASGQMRMEHRGGARPGARAAAAPMTRQTAGAALGGRVPTAVLERPPALGSTAGEAGGHRHRNGTGGGELLGSTIGVVERFSTMAGISFACILVAGFLLALAEVGSVANLFGTGYGQLLLVKMAVVGLLLFLAAYNRLLLLPWLSRGSSSSEPASIERGWRRLSATVRLEAVGMVAVLAVTAVLANGTPSNGATTPPPVPFAQTQGFAGGHVSLRITPNQALVNDWTVQFTGADGAPADLAESVSLYLVLPSQNIGPIETDMQKVGVGRFTLAGSPNPPVVGKWQIVLQVQVSEFSQPNVSFTDTVQ